MFDAKVAASRLTEKIYTVKGSNQANEVQRLLEEALRTTYKEGQQDANVPVPYV